MSLFFSVLHILLWNSVVSVSSSRANVYLSLLGKACGWPWQWENLFLFPWKEFLPQSRSWSLDFKSCQSLQSKIVTWKSKMLCSTDLLNNHFILFFKRYITGTTDWRKSTVIFLVKWRKKWNQISITQDNIIFSFKHIDICLQSLPSFYWWTALLCFLSTSGRHRSCKNIFLILHLSAR